MKNLWMLRTKSGLEPYDKGTEQLLKKVALNKLVKVDLVQPRNYEYHKRYFAMLNFAFDYWEPDLSHVVDQLQDLGIDPQGFTPEKDFDLFREKVTILAGYHDAVVGPEGTVVLKARSISFSKMSEETFKDLYRCTFRVVWDLILSKIPGMTEQEAHNAILTAESFSPT